MQKIVLEESYELGKGARHFVFSLERELDYIPGQFVSLLLDIGGMSVKRSYSIANKERGNKLLEIAITDVHEGLATKYLYGLKEGSELLCTGPFGKLLLPDFPSIKRYILVGTGTGISPYRSMLDNLSKQGKEVLILEGVKDREYVIYGEDFSKYANDYEHIQFIKCYSRGSISSKDEYKGYVQSYYDNLCLDIEGDVFLLCGNPHMIESSLLKLKGLGFGIKSIIREKYYAK